MTDRRRQLTAALDRRRDREDNIVRARYVRPAGRPGLHYVAPVPGERTVLAAGQKDIAVHGPFPEIEEELVAPHRDFWRR